MLHRFSSKPVSRVLSFKTAIYLDLPLPTGSSRPLSATGPVYCAPTALLRIEFTAADCSQPSGELLPRLSTLTHHQTSRRQAVYLCCTFPEVAFGGRYPLSLPCGARTFLMNRLSPCSRDCLDYSRFYFTECVGESQRLQNAFYWNLIELKDKLEYNI